MGSLVCVATDPGPLQSGLGDHRNRATGCKADFGCQHAQKQPATRRRRAAITQVGDDSCAAVWRHWHLRSPPTLGANEHLAGSPVDVTYGEGRDLVGPQAELGLQKQYLLWQNETHTLVSQLTWVEHSAAAESLLKDTPASPFGTNTNMNGARTTAINVANVRQINNIGRLRPTKRRHA